MGLVIRLFAFRCTFVINPDGEFYINQAKALYYGQWENFTTCGLSYLSNYPIFIAGAFTIFKDWIIAAKGVSLFFGTAALIPIYFTLKQFVDEKSSALALLIYAMMPVFVSRSVDVVKDPIFWFFLSAGIYGYVKQMVQRNNGYLFLSSICFLMATWSRIEAFLFVVASGACILIMRQEKKILRLLVFMLPILILLNGVLFAMLLGLSANDLNRLDEFTAYADQPIKHYKHIRAELRQLTVQFRNDILALFLPEARNLTWLIALGTLLSRALEAYFLPYFMLLLAGLGGIWKNVKQHQSVAYLFVLLVSGTVFLYLIILGFWILEYRWLALIIIPSFPFLGFGIERILRFLQAKWRLRESLALVLLCLFILVSALPKNLQPRREDKLVFKEIGGFIAQKENSPKEIIISTSRATQQWISFYANLNTTKAPCTKYSDICWDYFASDYVHLVKQLRKKSVQYFIWVERHWPVDQFDFLSAPYRQDFKQLGVWRHVDTGRMILYELIRT
jgi:hypothetical protein